MSKHYDYVHLDLGATETTETQIGTVTLNQSAKKIVGIAPVLVVETAAAGEGITAYCSADSPDINNLKPLKLPCQVVQGPAGTLADSGVAFSPVFYPVDIAVTGKADITFNVASLGNALTNTCHATIYVCYES